MTAGDVKPKEESETTITSDIAFQHELDSAKKNEIVLLIEMFSKWCGPCKVVRPALRMLVSEKLSCQVMFISVELDRVLNGLKQRNCEIDWSDVSDDTRPARWSRILLPWMGTIEPTFLYFRNGTLCAITEGLNLPQIEYNLQWLTQQDVDVTKIIVGITQKEINSAAYSIQCRWRSRCQLRRIGVFIDGVFKTHSEVARDTQLFLENQRREEREKRMLIATIVIQRYVRGFLARRWFQANKKQMIQRYRLLTRKGWRRFSKSGGTVKNQ